MLSSQLTEERGVEPTEETGGELSTCPLCELAHGTRTDLRVHLMTSHNKSEITEILLQAYEEPLAPL
ncbi:hypothetical protein SAMN04487949_3082 [Halogranum gelatinilyticum]|uniref:C2H2-type domain-containing protein n=1 Tax=Halogranum gelatinilyticum TaxID=660521 RepID=A0A1G9XPW3_9EURY|nr:hypothetical protein [Halogranum gelatinilyticum]SDM98869.1 hypothetical protein SAMN04487949_3082 [Halogranum gelatinilyticum]